MNPKIPRFIKCAATAVVLVANGSAHASLVGVNFALDMESTPTDAWSSTQIPESIPAGGWQNFSGDWSENGLTLASGSVEMTAYWDANLTWENDGVPVTSPYRGYLDDKDYNAEGASTSWAIEISGLDAWMAANGSSEWRLVLLRSSDSATAFRNVSIHTGTVSQLTSVGLLSSPSADWGTDPEVTSAVDNWPAGGTAGTITTRPIISSGGETAYADTNAFTGSSDAFILRDTGFGNVGGVRGSIAGFVLYTVPEPSSFLAAGMALCGMALRRRR